MTIAITSTGAEVRVGRTIVVRVGADELRFGSMAAAADHAAVLVGQVEGRRGAYRDERLRLGHFLRMVRAQVQHGEWMSFLEDLGARHGLAVVSLRRLELTARRVCNSRGELSPAMLRKCLSEQVPKCSRGITLDAKVARIVEGKAMPKLSLREVEELSGVRPVKPQSVKAEAEIGVVRHAGRERAAGGPASGRRPDVAGQIGMESLYERARTGMDRAVQMLADGSADASTRARLVALFEELAAIGEEHGGAGAPNGAGPRGG